MSDRGVAYVAMYVAVVGPTMWTLGYKYLTRGEEIIDFTNSSNRNPQLPFFG
jgi:predicted permease